MNRKRKGFLTMTVIIIFILVMVVIGVIYKYSTGNYAASKSQLRGMEATYLAKAGLEMGKSAALSEDNSGETLYDEYKTSPGKSPMKASVDNGKINELMQTSGKEASLWIYIGFATDEENEKLAPGAEDKFLKVASKAVIGKNGVQPSETINTDTDIKVDERLFFICLSDKDDQYYIDPTDENAWDKVFEDNPPNWEGAEL